MSLIKMFTIQFDFPITVNVVISNMNYISGSLTKYLDAFLQPKKQVTSNGNSIIGSHSRVRGLIQF